MSEQSESRMFRKLAESISLLAHELCEMRRERIESGGRSHAELATKCDLHSLREYIMASNAELVAELKSVAGGQRKTIDEIKALQAASDVLKTTITDLEAVVAAGGGPSQELTDAVAEVKAQQLVVDDLIPDVPPPVVIPT